MPAEKPATAARSQMPKGQGQTILLVDDEPALTKALQRLLQSLNYQVVTSNGAPEALTLFREKSGQFDVVITDLTMPEMNGLELAAQLHTIRPEVPVILASGYAPTMNREKLRAAGISEQLEKPLSMRVLADTLQRILFPKDQMNGR
jgi:CheY-like chemotaxis protein